MDIGESARVGDKVWGDGCGGAQNVWGPDCNLVAAICYITCYLHAIYILSSPPCLLHGLAEVNQFLTDSLFNQGFNVGSTLFIHEERRPPLTEPQEN